MNELLKEARDVLIEFGAGRRLNDLGYAELDKLLARINAYLAAPQVDAMELVGEIREIYREAGYESYMCGGDTKATEIILGEADSETAALIEARDRTVPRAMLEEIAGVGFDRGFDLDSKPISFDAIAAKYGIKVVDYDHAEPKILPKIRITHINCGPLHGRRPGWW